MYNQYGYPYAEHKREVPASSYIRVLHASPDAPAVDIYVNENPVARNVVYREFTQYTPIVGGLYNVKVYPAGATTNPVINTNVNIPPNSIFTVAAVGKLANISLLLVPEPPVSRNPGEVAVRFVHLSPDAPSVDVTLPNGTVLFKDIEYKEISPYITVRPGTYEIQAKVTGTNNVVLTVPNINLRPNNIYTIYAIGLAAGQPSLQVLIPLDGSTYLPVGAQG